MNKKLWHFFRLKKSTGDGHCLLHSIGLFLGKTSQNMCLLLTEYLKNVHAYKYPDVISSTALKKGLKAYVIHKRFNSKFCDILPQFLCDCFNLSMLIVTPRNYIRLLPHRLVSAGESQPLVKAAVYYKNLHYDAIIPRKAQAFNHSFFCEPTESVAVPKNVAPFTSETKKRLIKTMVKAVKSTSILWKRPALTSLLPRVHPTLPTTRKKKHYGPWR